MSLQKRMDNQGISQSVILAISSSVSNQTLEALSNTPAWSDVKDSIISGGSELLTAAIEGGQTKIGTTLLESGTIDLGIGSLSLLYSAIDNNESEILQLLLKDRRIDPTSISDSLISRAISKNNETIIEILLSDPRIYWNHSPELLAARLNNSDQDRLKLWTINAIILYGNVDLNAISPRILKNIISYIREYIQKYIQGAIRLGKTSTGDIISRLTGSSIYDTFLRELILKRSSLEYYLDWMLDHLEDVMILAARSILSSEPVIHDSDLFTAYRGFLLLALDDNGENVMRTLEQEQGVTQDGLKLAGMLVGAMTVR